MSNAMASALVGRDCHAGLDPASLAVARQRFRFCHDDPIMARPSPWPDKVMALLRAGNAAAAIAQVRVAPGVRELKSLEKALAAAGLAGKWPAVDAAITESLQALSAPRLHRSP